MTPTVWPVLHSVCLEDKPLFKTMVSHHCIANASAYAAIYFPGNHAYIAMHHPVAAGDFIATHYLGVYPLKARLQCLPATLKAPSN